MSKDDFNAAAEGWDTPVRVLVALVFALFLPLAQAASLDEIVAAHEARLGGRIGLAILDTRSGKLQAIKGVQRFPMMSTSKTLACANLLARVDAGDARLGDTVRIRKQALVTYSPVTEKFVDQPFTLGQACDAAMQMSDNTAANLVLQSLGGPAALTRFVRGIGDELTRLDRTEPELNSAEKDDPRDTSTPVAMVQTLNKLVLGDALKPQSRKQLTQWMLDNKVADPLFRAVLPAGWRIADRSGAGANGSRGITAVIWPMNRPPLVVSLYLTQTHADMNELNRTIAAIGEEIFAQYR